MDEIWQGARLLVLLGVANASPILAKRFLGARWALPLDGGARFLDGRPVLGPSKTVRGVLSAVAATTLAAPALGIPAGIGAAVGAATMAGDALSSFVKRRLGIAPSGRATGLDQVPETLLPLLAVQGSLGLSAAQIAGITLLFVALGVPFAKLFHRLGLRDRPY